MTIHIATLNTSEADGFEFLLVSGISGTITGFRATVAVGPPATYSRFYLLVNSGAETDPWIFDIPTGTVDTGLVTMVAPLIVLAPADVVDVQVWFGNSYTPPLTVYLHVTEPTGTFHLEDDYYDDLGYAL